MDHSEHFTDVSNPRDMWLAALIGLWDAGQGRNRCRRRKECCLVLRIPTLSSEHPLCSWSIHPVASHLPLPAGMKTRASGTFHQQGLEDLTQDRGTRELQMVVKSKISISIHPRVCVGGGVTSSSHPYCLLCPQQAHDPGQFTSKHLQVACALTATPLCCRFPETVVPTHCLPASPAAEMIHVTFDLLTLRPFSRLPRYPITEMLMELPV